MPASIYSIGTAVPEHKINQQEIAAFMANQYTITHDDKKKIELMYARSGIKHRYSVIDDFVNQKFNHLKNRDNADTDIATRMQLYLKHAPKLAKSAILNATQNTDYLNNVTHFITVSCTGMAAPGLDIILTEQLGLNPQVSRTSVNFMGCYAAMHALKQARQICIAQPDALVLIVCVELCTLHFQSNYTADNVTANLLFADGAAACIVGSNQNMAKINLNNFASSLIFKGKTDMSWHIGNTGFLMSLSNYIPDLIEQNFTAILQANNFVANDFNWFAIHPGGRKILDKLSVELKLKKNALQVSYDVLSAFGNMSSPTLLFVLNQLLRTKPLVTGDKILAAAFGPGITIELGSFTAA
jgi:predicted naringenin-chalcone synthase